MKIDKAAPHLASRRTVIAAGAAIAALGRMPLAVAQAGAGGTPSVGVVGAGVVGLNVARVFAEQGYKVTVYAAKVSPGTTSDVAPAVLFPHLIPVTAQMTDAARRSNEFYASFLNAGVGVTPRSVQILDNSPDLDPDLAPWGPTYGGIVPIPRDQVPANFGYGWTFQTMLLDVRKFFPYLMNRVLATGTTITLRTVATRHDLLALPHPIIANCSGLGARGTRGDQAVYRLRDSLCAR